MARHVVAAAGEIPPGGRKLVTVRGRQIGIFNHGGEYFALLNRCPHKRGRLSQGIVHGHAVTCPLHNWNIALATGEAQGADEGCTPVIPVKVSGNRVLLCRASALKAAA